GGGGSARVPAGPPQAPGGRLALRRGGPRDPGDPPVPRGGRMSPRRAAANPAASARARLGTVARRRGVELQLVLSEFAVERLLYRLGVSPHAGRFVLKGATLFKLWFGDRGRATWDLDLLGRGASGVVDLVAVMRELCGIPGGD